MLSNLPWGVFYTESHHYISEVGPNGTNRQSSQIIATRSLPEKQLRNKWLKGWRESFTSFRAKNDWELEQIREDHRVITSTLVAQVAAQNPNLRGHMKLKVW